MTEKPSSSSGEPKEYDAFEREIDELLNSAWDDDSSPINPDASRTPQEILNQKLGHHVNKIVINTIDKEEIDKAVNAAVNEKLKEQSAIAKKIQLALPGIAGLAISALKKAPLIGTVVAVGGKNISDAIRATYHAQKAREAIKKSGNLADAFKELGVEEKNDIYGKDSSAETMERASMIIERAQEKNPDQEIEELKYGRADGLRKGESIKKVENENSPKVNEALTTLYEKLKAADGDETKQEAARKEFDKEIQLLQKQGAFGQKVMGDKIQDLSGIKDLASNMEELVEHNINKEDLKAYLDEHISLYNASMKNGINTKQQINNVANAVLQGGLAAGIAYTAKDIIIKSGGRSALKTALSSTPVVGAIMGGITGLLRGSEQAKIKLSESEIKDTINGEPVDTEDTEEDTADDSGNRQPKVDFIVSFMSKLNQFKKGLTKEDVILEAIKEKRNRVSAKSYYDKLGELMDGELTEENIGEIHDIIAEIEARNEVSDERGIDLISYSKGNAAKERRLLMERIWEAEKKLGDNFNDATVGIQRHTHIEELTKTQDEIKKLENQFKRNQILAETVQGALTGFAFGFLAQKASELAAAKSGAAGAAAGIKENARDFGGEKHINPEDMERIRSEGAPILIEDDPQGGIAIAIDKDGDGIIDANEYLYGDGEGINGGIDLTDEETYNNINQELNQYGVELQREQLDIAEYKEMSVGEYLEKTDNVVDNSGGVDWSRSETRVAFGMPVVAEGSDGMDTYEVDVWGKGGGAIPVGAKLYIDLDGDYGPGGALEFDIVDGKAIIPADVLNTSNLGSGGVASFIGTVRVGEMDGNRMISYATAFGEKADLSTTISAVSDSDAYAFTAVDMDSQEKLSQFAVDVSGKKISNLSEIFKGIPVSGSDRLPAGFTVGDIDGNTEDIVLASGEKVPDLDYRGGYQEQFNSFENKAFIGKSTYLGTPMEWDPNGDGVMDATEEANYLRQLFVKTGTDPFVLGQNASNYGLLEPDRLESIIPADKLIEWGITDGVVDSEAELNILLEHLKEPANADYYDGLVNATINKMGSDLQGGSFEPVRILDRQSTYLNSRGALDTCPSGSRHWGILPKGADGEPVGNEGWWARKYGVEGGRVYYMPDCDQVGTEQEKTTPEKTTPEKTTPEKTTPEKTTPEKTTPEKTTPEKTTDESTLTEKNIEAEIKNAGEDVVPEYVETPASDLSSSEYEVDADNLTDNTIYTETSAENADKAAEDAAAAAEGAVEAKEINKEIGEAAESGGRAAADQYKANLYQEFLKTNSKEGENNE